MKPFVLALGTLSVLSCTPREEPFTTVGGGSSLHQSGWGNLSAHVFSSGRKRVQYAIVTANHDFEPMCPSLTYTHSYSIDYGGTLTVNGRPISPQTLLRVLALNPFGQMEESSISDAEAAILRTDQPDPIWEKVVLPHLAVVDGKTLDGKRVGHWTVSGKSGVKGYEGDYFDGKRDGQWKYYSADGRLRATLSYRLGKLDGEATEVDPDGKVARRVRWKDDLPLDGPQTWRSLSATMTRNPDGSGNSSFH